MIKFTMGSSDAKKTQRRKPKRTGKNSYLLASNPSVSTSSQAASGAVNGCFQNSMPTSANTLMHTPGDSLMAYSQWQQRQEVQTVQKPTLVGEKEGEVMSNLSFPNFYLNGEICFVCHRPKIENNEFNLGQFVESDSGVDVSTFPQLWVCLECQSFNRGGIDPMTNDLHEEILLDPPSSPVIGDASERVSLNTNSCNCSSCTETRLIKEQNENFEQELQQYLYEDLHRLVNCVYRSSLSGLAADAHEGYQPPDVNTEKIHSLMQRIYCRDPQRLFQCLESWAEEFITERRSCLCVYLPANDQRLTVSMASQLITSLLDEYNCFCVICQNLVSFLDLQENPMLKGFQMTIELHHKYLFHRLIFAELQKYLTSAITLISLQSTKLRKENAAASNSYAQLLHEYVKLQDDMSRILMDWGEYCQLTEYSKDENPKQKVEGDGDNLRHWSRLQKQTKTLLNVPLEGTENHFMERVWQASLQDSNKTNVDLHYPGYSGPCLCKCDVEKMLVCAGMGCSDASSMVAFPNQLFLTGCSQTIPYKNTSPSASKSSGSFSSGSASPDDIADSDHILATFIESSRDELFSSVSDIVNGVIQLEQKEEEEEEDDDDEEEEDDDEEDEDGDGDENDNLNNAPTCHLIANLHSHSCRGHNDRDDRGQESSHQGLSDHEHLNVDDNNSSAEDADDDEDYYSGDINGSEVKNRVLRVAVTESTRAGDSTSTHITDSLIATVTSASVSPSAFSVTTTYSSASTSVSGVAGSVASAGKLFAFEEHPDTKAAAIGSSQQQQQQQCQCSSCVCSSIAADLPQQSIMPSISNLNIYPHIHGPTISGLQPGHTLNCDTGTSRPMQELHHLQLRCQHGDGMEQATPKVLGVETNGIFLNQALLSEWELQNSSFFVKQNDYSKILLATGGPPLTTISLTSNASVVQPNLDDGRVWFKLDRPTTLIHSGVSPPKGVTMASSGVFNISSNDLRHSVPQLMSSGAPVFPLSMPVSIPAAKYGTDQQPYRFQMPMPVTTSASTVFNMSSSFYQITAAPAAFVQPQSSCQAIGVAAGDSATSLYDLASSKLAAAPVGTTCINGTTLCGTGTSCSTNGSALCNGIALRSTGMNTMNGATSNGSVMDGANKSPHFFDHRTSLASSTPAAVISPPPSEAMAQFNLSPCSAASFPSINFSSSDATSAITTSSHVPAGYHNPLPCRRVCSQPSNNTEDDHSVTSCKTDSQQDEDGFNSQDESGSSGSNQKDGKYCDCWHCEVFGHSTPLTLPTSKNYSEMRDRLRLRLKKKQNELKTQEPEKEEEIKAPVPVKRKTLKQESVHMKDIEELLKYINGEADTAEKPAEDDLVEKSKAKAAKRSRQKLRKLQQKAKESIKSAVLDEKLSTHCDLGRQKSSQLSGCSRHLSSSYPKEPSNSILTSSKASTCCKQGNNSDKEKSSKIEHLKLLNVLSSMKINGECASKSEDSATSRSYKVKDQGSDSTWIEDGITGKCNGICEQKKNRKINAKVQVEQTACHPSGPAEINGSFATGMMKKTKNDLPRQCTSQHLFLEKKESVSINNPGTREDSSLKGKEAGAEKRGDAARVEEGMKPVTISSDEGMRTILASPLLQAELAKNKPLQKLFMQAVQQQQLSREKQEASVAANAESKVRQSSLLQMKTPQENLQVHPSVERNPSSVVRLQHPAAKACSPSSDVKQEQHSLNCSQSKIMLKNATQCSSTKGIKLKQNTPQTKTSLGKADQNATQFNAACENKNPLNATKLIAIPSTKLPQNSAQPKVSALGKKLQLTEEVHRMPGRGGEAGSSKMQQKIQVQPEAKQLESHANGVQQSSHVALVAKPRSLRDADVQCQTSSAKQLNVNSSAQSGSSNSKVQVLSVPAEAKDKLENKKVNGSQKKSKKSLLSVPSDKWPDGYHSMPDEKDRAFSCNKENKSHVLEVRDQVCTGGNCLQKTNAYSNGDQQNLLIPLGTAPAATPDLMSNEMSDVAGTACSNGMSAKAKKSKKKGKARNSMASVDEIFLPKNVPDDSHLDEHEREIEEFKRFCSNSAPSGNRQKVNLNNVKDIFNKKKAAAAGY